jgi:hypothetical protein
MSSTLQLPQTNTSSTPAQQLRTTMAAVRLSISWLGTRKALNAEQRSRAADTFGAEGEFISAGKKLLDTRHPAFKAVTTIKSRAVSLWNGMTLPYPEDGIRLIRQQDIDLFDAQMQTLQNDLENAVASLDEHLSELKLAARERLGSLYNEGDYPETLHRLFAISCDFPSVEPPNYLQQLSPELYRQECQRVASRFDEAVQLAEAAFSEELARLVSHLTERLAGTDDGKPKVFRDSAVDNLRNFFERFRMLNVSSSEELEELVDQCGQIVRGVEPQQLRDQAGLRQHVATELSAVQSMLDGMLVDRPRRNILRRPK